MKSLLILNPGSRSGRGKRRWEGWKRALSRAGFSFTCAVTQGPGHARRLARESVNVDSVVAVGGDGTLNEVLDGILQSERPGRALGVLYAGTSPDFCRFHGIPVDPPFALATLLAGKVKKVDVARITYSDEKGRRIRAHFACSSNIGLGAMVARISNRTRWLLGDALGTGYALVRALSADRRVDLQMEIDGETVLLPETNHLFVVKNPFIASGLKLDLDLKPADGRMVAVGVHSRRPARMWASLPSFYSGSVTTSHDVYLKGCRSIAVRSNRPVEIEFDGDPRGFLPVEIDLQPQTLALIGANHE
ncbi:MAG: diacylglycerol/lipid kinase family protein [Planctomycetota bacterium]|jgi:diacylglycerol kinase family enzyme